jgi:hypothetical protein
VSTDLFPNCLPQIQEKLRADRQIIFGADGDAKRRSLNQIADLIKDVSNGNPRLRSKGMRIRGVVRELTNVYKDAAKNMSRLDAMHIDKQKVLADYDARIEAEARNAVALFMRELEKASDVPKRPEPVSAPAVQPAASADKPQLPKVSKPNGPSWQELQKMYEENPELFGVVQRAETPNEPTPEAGKSHFDDVCETLAGVEPFQETSEVEARKKRGEQSFERAKGSVYDPSRADMVALMADNELGFRQVRQLSTTPNGWQPLVVDYEGAVFVIYENENTLNATYTFCTEICGYDPTVLAEIIEGPKLSTRDENGNIIRRGAKDIPGVTCRKHYEGTSIEEYMYLVFDDILAQHEAYLKQASADEGLYVVPRD